MTGAETYLLVKFHLDPSNRLATIHQRHRQTDRQTGQDRTDRQRSDSIVQTVLQTVAQKLWLLVIQTALVVVSWLRGPAVEHRSLAGVLSLSCTRLAADG